MSTVYVLEDNPRMNFTTAREFADLVTPIFDSGYSAGLSADRITDKLERVMESYNADTDYIIPNGDPAIMLAFGFVAAKHMDYITVLKWDRQTKRYFPVQFST